jgi:hypothetical protein
MKEIIYSSQNLISFDAVKNFTRPLIGFQKLDDCKVTLVPASYCGELYLARSVNGWEHGNRYYPHGKVEQTFQEWCKFFHDTHKAKMFLFDTPQELFKWLSE